MRWLVVLSVQVLLAACAENDEDQLRRWLTEQRTGMRPAVQALPEPTKFVPQPYAPTTAPDPFSIQKLVIVLRRESMQANTNTQLVAPELSRRKQPLETFPIDSMAMVGSLIKPDQTVGLVRVGNLIYQVRVGNYLAQNYGRVVSISESEIVLREIVQDSAGEWTERKTSLQLLERAK